MNNGSHCGSLQAQSLTDMFVTLCRLIDVNGFIFHLLLSVFSMWHDVFLSDILLAYFILSESFYLSDFLIQQKNWEEGKYIFTALYVSFLPVSVYVNNVMFCPQS